MQSTCVSKVRRAQRTCNSRSTKRLCKWRNVTEVTQAVQQMFVVLVKCPTPLWIIKCEPCQGVNVIGEQNCETCSVYARMDMVAPRKDSQNGGKRERGVSGVKFQHDMFAKPLKVTNTKLRPDSGKLPNDESRGGPEQGVPSVSGGLQGAL
eukprot:5460354-Heterocapsa_arctica.AAC.1